MLKNPLSAKAFQPGLSWLDDRGLHIQAHGGGIVKLGEIWYWFGEDRSQDNDSATRYVACYSSKDLLRWKFHRQVLKLSDPGNFGPDWCLERPKVFFNAKTGKFVMYMHIDGRITPNDSFPYSVASLGIAICDKVDGDYQYLRHFRPLGRESRDIGQFIDDDGSAYLIFECRPEKGFFITSLSEDFLNVEKEVCFIRSPLEGGAIVRHQNLYYVIGSSLTGWWPNANKYATSSSLSGPWSEFKDFAPPHTHTYGSQSSNLIKIEGTKATTVIYVGDRWRPEEPWDSRYIWMPLEIGAGKLELPEPRPWTFDIKTGEINFPPIL